MPRKTRERIPRSLDGILDMIGPKTLDVGYSPSQYMSSDSAKMDDGVPTNVGLAAILLAGTNADTARA